MPNDGKRARRLEIGCMRDIKPSITSFYFANTSPGNSAVYDDKRHSLYAVASSIIICLTYFQRVNSNAHGLSPLIQPFEV